MKNISAVKAILKTYGESTFLNVTWPGNEPAKLCFEITYKKLGGFLDRGGAQALKQQAKKKKRKKKKKIPYDSRKSSSLLEFTG